MIIREDKWKLNSDVSDNTGGQKWKLNSDVSDNTGGQKWKLNSDVSDNTGGQKGNSGDVSDNTATTRTVVDSTNSRIFVSIQNQQIQVLYRIQNQQYQPEAVKCFKIF